MDILSFFIGVALGVIVGVKSIVLGRSTSFANNITDFKYTSKPPERPKGLSRGSKVKNMDVKPETHTEVGNPQPPKPINNTTTYGSELLVKYTKV